MSASETLEATLKQTPFREFHVAAGAKMVPFAGYEMPIQYSSMTAEHLAVRENVGLFDLSHMGEFVVRGSGALEFLQQVTCNDVSALSPGQIQYTAMLDNNGCFIDDLLLYHCGDHYFLVVNASNIDKDFAWLQKHVPANVTLTNRSDDYALLAIQGPNAERVAQKLTPDDLSEIGYYYHKAVSIYGITTLVSRTGYTGEDGFEIYLRPDQANDIWEMVIAAGKPFEMSLIGLGARDSLRLEMKMALYGNDIDVEHTPLEAGLGWIVKLDKGEFIGRDVLLKQKDTGVTRKLVCIEFSERCIPRHGYPLVDETGAESGVVTSGVFSPSLQKPIAMGYLPAGHSKIGSKVSVKIREKLFGGAVVKQPFYKQGSHK